MPVLGGDGLAYGVVDTALARATSLELDLEQRAIRPPPAQAVDRLRAEIVLAVAVLNRFCQDDVVAKVSDLQLVRVSRIVADAALVPPVDGCAGLVEQLLPDGFGDD